MEKKLDKVAELPARKLDFEALSDQEAAAVVGGHNPPPPPPKDQSGVGG